MSKTYQRGKKSSMNLLQDYGRFTMHYTVPENKLRGNATQRKRIY